MLSTYIIFAAAIQPTLNANRNLDAFTQITQQDAKQAEKLKVGDPAPPFRLTKWNNGGDMQLTDRKDQVAVLTFWNTTTPQSTQVINKNQELYTKLKGQPMAWFYVNSWDENSAYTEWMTKNSGLYGGHWAIDPAGSDPSNIASKWYSVSTVPTVFVIGRDGRVFAIIDGYQTGDSRLDDALRRAGIKID